MSETDPNKMKVVELRSELSVRGLDTKGNKAALVKRLKTAMAKEAGAVADENGMEQDGAELEEGDSKSESQLDAEDEILQDDSVEDEQAMEVPEETNEDEILEQAEAVDAEETTKDDAPAADDEAAGEEAAADDEAMTEAKEADGDEAAPAENAEKSEDKTDESKTNGDHKDDGDKDKKEDGDKDKKEDGDKDKKEDGDKDKKEDGDKDKKDDDKDRRNRKRKHSGSRDHRNEQPEKKKPPPPLEDLEEFDANLVILDIYVSDLNLKLNEKRCGGTPLTDGGFAFMWAGAKSVYGVKEGKVCFEVKITKKEDVKHLPSDEANPHVVRVGFSDVSSGLQLGEEPLSYGYGGTGKFSTDCKFTDYGKVFSEGDIVQCFLDMDSEPAQLSYSVNGEHLGVAAEIPKESLNDSPLFAHILTKNCSFEVNFGQNEEPFKELPEGYTDYQFMQAVDLEKRVRGPTCPEKKEDCEMIMMCGLPGAGKTHWSIEHVKSNPDKRYTVIGTNSIIDKMKVMGLPRKRNYSGRWDALIEKSTSCLNKMLYISSRRRRNYILDQTNVYPTAQRRKMRPFEGFQRKAVVIIPTDDEFKARIEKRTKEEGKDVPETAVLEMKAHFMLPEVGELFSSVELVELQGEEAQKLVDQYRKEGQAALPAKKRYKRYDRRNRDRRSGGGSGGSRDNRSRPNYPSSYNRNRGPPPRPWHSGGGGGGSRPWDYPDRNYGPSRAYGASRNGPGGGRSYPPPPSQGRRSWPEPRGPPPRERDMYRGGRPQPSIKYNQPSGGRSGPPRSGPPQSRGYGQGYGGQGGYSSGGGSWNPAWGGSGGYGGGGGYY